jgi:uncharacterized membrane protein YdfJ with MMPL/SSD domain
MTMNLQTRLFPWVTLALIIAIVLLVWMFFENGRTKDTFQRDRELSAEREGNLQKKLRQSDGYILTLEGDLSEMREMYLKNQDSLKRKIKASTVKFIPIEKIDRLDTCLHQVVIRQRAIDDQTALISSLETEKVQTKAKNEVIKDDLKGQIKLLDSANTAKFNKIDSLYDNWPKKQSAWGLGATAGISTLLSDGKFYAGPGVTFGLTYKIPIGKIRIRDLFRKKK